MEDFLKPLSSKRVNEFNNGLQSACTYMSDDKSFKFLSDTHDMIADTLCTYKTNNRNHPINYGLRHFANLDMGEYCNKNPDQCKYIDYQVNNMCKNRVDMKAVRNLACNMKFKTTCTDDDKCDADWTQSSQTAKQFGDKLFAACNDGTYKSNSFKDEYAKYMCKQNPSFFETHTNMKDDDIYKVIPFLKSSNVYACNNMDQAIEMSCQTANATRFLATNGSGYLILPQMGNKARRRRPPGQYGGGRRKKEKQPSS